MVIKPTLTSVVIVIACAFAVCLVVIATRRPSVYNLMSKDKEIERLSGFSGSSPDSMIKKDGYVSASAYRQALASSAKKGQMAYISEWKAKNLAGAREAVKGAAELYNKWDVVDPYTGYSKDDLSPYSSWKKVKPAYILELFPATFVVRYSLFRRERNP
jgi:hypothetical protein